MESIDKLHGAYGLQVVQLSPALDSLFVQYDATRMGLDDLDRVLHSAGLAVRRVAA